MSLPLRAMRALGASAFCALGCGIIAPVALLVVIAFSGIALNMTGHPNFLNAPFGIHLTEQFGTSFFLFVTLGAAALGAVNGFVSSIQDSRKTA